MDPLIILKSSINKVPALKYALGVAGIVATIAIIKTLAVEDTMIPIVSILILFGFMILLFVFSALSNSKDLPLRIAGYTLIYTTTIITCISSFLLATSVFLEFPKPIDELLGFKKKQVNQVNLRKEAGQVNNLVIYRNYSDIYPIFSQGLKVGLTTDIFYSAIDSVKAHVGRFEHAIDTSQNNMNGDTFYYIKNQHENGQSLTTVSFDDNHQIIALYHHVYR